mmetsp:Transcript_1295/g.4015  ORF Transcript_1295/g.4015 Transcript_1295/m.4015 type:complete len:253 (+) Transcript_1295:51-809(+)
MEGLQLVCLHGRLILMQVRQGVLGTVVVRIIVGVDGLRLQPRDGVKFLDGCCPEPRKGTEDRPLDLRDLRVLHGVHERVLRLRGVVLQLLGGVLLAEGRDLVEVHLQVVRHLLGQVVFGGARAQDLAGQLQQLHARAALAAACLQGCRVRARAAQQLAEEQRRRLLLARRLLVLGRPAAALLELLLEDCRVADPLPQRLHVNGSRVPHLCRAGGRCERRGGDEGGARHHHCWRMGGVMGPCSPEQGKDPAST